jgi:hypothetical protein
MIADAPKPLWRRRAFGPGASAIVAARMDRRFGIKGKAHGQKGTFSGCPLIFNRRSAGPSFPLALPAE